MIILKALDRNTSVQTVIFDSRFFDEKKARAWLKANGFSASKVDAKEGTIRFRQRETSDFLGTSFRTITLARGVKAVVGRLEKGDKDDDKVYKDGGGFGGGMHGHALMREQGETMDDGAHAHLFRLHDGRFVMTEVDGTHRHSIGEQDNETGADASAHTHKLVVGEKEYIISAGEHPHKAGLYHTAIDGMHHHMLQMDNGEALRSLMPGELYRMLHEGEFDEDIENENDPEPMGDEPDHANEIFIAKGPPGAIAFVSMSPSKLDCARGENFTGLIGRTFARSYLEPIGLRKQDVIVANIVPDGGSGHPEKDEIEKNLNILKSYLGKLNPKCVIALGKAAKENLKGIADYSMPHPKAVLKHGDSGEISRKLRHVLKYVASISKSVRIAKTDEEKQIVYGVVIDPYQIDSQGDWVSPQEIEATAHEWFQSPRINLHHDSDEVGGTRAVESWVVEYPSEDDYRNAVAGRPHRAFRREFGGDMVHSGAWIVGTKLSDSLWEAFKAGEIGSYSIEGTGTRRSLMRSEMPRVEFIEQFASGESDQKE